MSTTVDDTRNQRELFTDLTHDLVVEFSEVHAPGTVLRCVARARDELRQHGVRDGLAEAASAMARRRLQQRSPAGGVRPTGRGPRV